MKYDDGYKYIGANIQAYNHFDCFMIPYPSGSSVISTKDLHEEDFLKLVVDYYKSKTLVNMNYFDDMKECNAHKKFIKRQINDESSNIGREWANSQIWIAV